MRNKRMIAALLCGALLLGGCGKPGTREGETPEDGEVQGVFQEEAGPDDDSMETEQDTSEGGRNREQGGGNAGEGSSIRCTISSLMIHRRRRPLIRISW